MGATSQTAVVGEALAPVAGLERIEGAVFSTHPDATWVLHGVRSNERSSTRTEHDQLAGVQAGLSRPQSTRARLIPMSKSPAWRTLSQDERRSIFEGPSRHIAIGAKYLPSLARRLSHGRDLGAAFDFLTCFESAPADEAAFDALLLELRSSAERRFVSREVELRLSRAG